MPNQQNLESVQQATESMTRSIRGAARAVRRTGRAARVAAADAQALGESLEATAEATERAVSPRRSRATRAAAATMEPISETARQELLAQAVAQTNEELSGTTFPPMYIDENGDVVAEVRREDMPTYRDAVRRAAEAIAGPHAAVATAESNAARHETVQVRLTGDLQPTALLAGAQIRTGDVVTINDQGYVVPVFVPQRDLIHSRDASGNRASITRGDISAGSITTDRIAASTITTVPGEAIAVGGTVRTIDPTTGENIELGRVTAIDGPTITVEHDETAIGRMTSGRKLRGLPEGFELKIAGWWAESVDSEAGRLRLRFRHGRESAPVAVFYSQKMPNGMWECEDTQGETLAQRSRWRQCCKAAIIVLNGRDANHATVEG